MSKKTECVKVAVRCRPLSRQENEDKRKRIVDVDQARGEIRLQNVKGDSNDVERVFAYDLVFDITSQQEQVYSDTALPIVESVLDGYNGTIFAYGQTGTGKTHTMEGRNEPQHERGIIPRTFEHVFRSIEGTPIQFLVRASYLELYNEEVRDLLSKSHLNKLELREKPDQGVYVKDLSRQIVKSVAELNEWLASGRANRKVGETKMNQESSRSHSIFTLTIESCETDTSNEQHIKAGKLNLVDLAGSERQQKTQATGDRFKEAININQSLTSLGNVINALVDAKAQHVPYRDSKLTRLLQDSLGGNTKTVMIANIGPADYNFDETLSTLRYASRAKNIKNKPKVNEDPKETMIREYQDEIVRLKEQLAQRLGGQLGPDGQVLNNKQQKQVREKEVQEDDEEQLRMMQSRIQREKEIIHKRAEEERQRIEQEKNLAEDEKKQLLKKLEDKERKQNIMKKDEENLLIQIKKMEKQLVHGDKMKEESRIKEKQLLKARIELEERKQQERRLAEEIAKKDAIQMDAEQKYKSLQDEIDGKTKKLNQIVQKVKETKQQTSEIHEYRQREKENLLEENRQLMQQMKLMNIIIEHFIPSEEGIITHFTYILSLIVRKLEAKLEFSQEVDDWLIKDTDEETRIERPSSCLEFKRPLCEFARMAINFGDQNPRFRPENILQMDLDLPERTTEEFDGNVSQKLQETINIVLQEDEEEIQMIQSEKQPNVYIEDPAAINKEAILNPPVDPKARAKSARKMSARRPASGVKRI